TLKGMLRPYRGAGDLWARAIVREVVRQSGPHDRVVVVNALDCTEITFRWQLTFFPGRIDWGGAVDPSWLADTGQVWCLQGGAWQASRLPGWGLASEPLALRGEGLFDRLSVRLLRILGARVAESLEKATRAISQTAAPSDPKAVAAEASRIDELVFARLKE